MIDLDAHFCSPGHISSASHKTTHNQETNTHWQSVKWTQSCASTRPFGCHCSLALPRVTLQTLGLWVWPRFSEKSEPLIYGPIWSHMWWEMVPDTNLQRSHGPTVCEKWSQQLSKCRYLSTDLSTRSVDRSRSISTVNKDSPTWEYGRYRRSMPIHLRRITVDRRLSIKNRDNLMVDFIDDTCGILQIEKFTVVLYDWKLFFANFCEFFLKIKLDTLKRL